MLLLVNLQVKAEILTGGNMEDADSWNVTQNCTDEALYATATFNYTDDVPTDGSGGCLYLTASCGDNWASTNVTIWQEVELDSGHAYIFDGAFKDLGESLTESFWLQVYLDTTTVVEGEDYNVEDSAKFAINGWNSSCDYDGIDVSFSDFECDNSSKNDTVEITKSGTYVFAIKIGCTYATENSYEVLLDELSLKDLSDSTSSDDSTSTSAISVSEGQLAIVSPNPFTSDLTVSAENTISEINVFDVLGQKVKKVSGVNTTTAVLNLDDLKSGAYYVMVEDINGSKQIVKTLKIE